MCYKPRSCSLRGAPFQFLLSKFFFLLLPGQTYTALWFLPLFLGLLPGYLECREVYQFSLLQISVKSGLRFTHAGTNESFAWKLIPWPRGLYRQWGSSQSLCWWDASESLWHTANQTSSLHWPSPGKKEELARDLCKTSPPNVFPFPRASSFLVRAA